MAEKEKYIAIPFKDLETGVLFRDRPLRRYTAKRYQYKKVILDRAPKYNPKETYSLGYNQFDNHVYYFNDRIETDMGYVGSIVPGEIFSHDGKEYIKIAGEVPESYNNTIYGVGLNLKDYDLCLFKLEYDVYI